MESSCIVDVESGFDIALVKSEAIDNLENLDNLCRICALTSDHMIPIFGDLHHQLYEKINTYLYANITTDDTLPLQICDNCASTILAWHDIVTGWDNAQEKLRNIRAKIEAEQKAQNASTSFYKNNEVELLVPKTEPEDEFVQEEILISDDDEEMDNEDDEEFNLTPQTISPISSTLASPSISHYNPGPINRKREQELLDIINIRRKSINKEAIVKYRKVENGKVFYNCTYCGKNLSSPYTFTDHLRIHTGEKPYACAICDQRFRIKQFLVNHLLVRHNESTESQEHFLCRVCYKAFETKELLDKHKVTHICDFPFVCDTCNKRFRTEENYTKHVQERSCDKPFICDICKKPFKTKKSLNKHSYTHNQDRPWKCELCNVCFKQKRYLVGHISRHKQNDKNTKPVGS